MKKFILVIMLLTLIYPIGQVNAEVQSGMESGFELTSTTYVVAMDDTLWSIAKDNDVSFEDLISWNNLDSTTIHPGQQLIIGQESKNAKKVTLDTYTVKRGDTLIEIAQHHDISLEELIHSNSISSYLIYPGDKLIVQGESISKPFSTAAAITTINDEGIRAPIYNSPIDIEPTIAQEKTKTITNTPKMAGNEPVSSTSTTKSKNTVATPAPSSGKEMTVTATAYTAYCTGCSGTTYTGINLRANPNQKVIAVDPNVIPLGSKVWVEGYGEAIAGDIGGAIKGNIIDVFLEHKQDAMKWGRKTVKIKVLD